MAQGEKGSSILGVKGSSEILNNGIFSVLNPRPLEPFEIPIRRVGMLQTLEERVRYKHTALIIVDMQNDFCHEDGAFGKMGLNLSLIQKVATPMKNLIESAHLFGVPVIFTKMLHSQWTNSEAWVQRNRSKKKGWVDEDKPSYPYCLPDTWGADWYGVPPAKEDYVVIKHRYGGFINTDLNLILRSLQKKSVIVTGVDTTLCVDCTARGALMHDYYVIVAADCCGGVDEEEHRFTLRTLDKYFGIVTTSDEIIRIWNAQKNNPRHNP